MKATMKEPKAEPTTGLSIPQKEARRFWCEMQTGTLLPSYCNLNISSLVEKHNNINQFDTILAELEQVISMELKFNTTFKVIREEYENTKLSEWKFWRGTYRLFDGKGNEHVLSLKDEVSCEGEIVGYTFENATLSFKGKNISGELTFSLPKEIDKDDSDSLLEHLNKGNHTVPTCEGILSILRGMDDEDKNIIEEVNVNGKLNTYSHQGVLSNGFGDPVEFWNGVYSIIFIDENNKYQYTDKELLLNGRTGNGGNQQIFMRFDSDVVTSNIGLLSNMLGWENGTLSFVKYNDTFEFSGKITQNGKEKYVLGYRKRMFDEQKNLLKSFGKTTAKRALTASAVTIDPITLNKATINDHYLCTLHSTTTNSAPKLTWKVKQGELPKGLTLFEDGTIEGMIKEDVAGDFTFLVEVEDTGMSPSEKDTEKLQLTVQEAPVTLKIEDLTLNPAALEENSINYFTAKGGNSAKYQWRIKGTDAEARPAVGDPDGLINNGKLKFETITEMDGTIKAKLSGTITDATKRGDHDLIIELTDGTLDINKKVIYIEKRFVIKVTDRTGGAENFGWTVLGGVVGIAGTIASIALSVVIWNLDRNKAFEESGNKGKYEHFKDYINKAKQFITKNTQLIDKGEVIVENLIDLKEQVKRRRGSFDQYKKATAKSKEIIRAAIDSVIVDAEKKIADQLVEIANKQKEIDAEKKGTNDTDTLKELRKERDQMKADMATEKNKIKEATDIRTEVDKLDDFDGEFQKYFV